MNRSSKKYVFLQLKKCFYIFISTLGNDQCINTTGPKCFRKRSILQIWGRTLLKVNDQIYFNIHIVFHLTLANNSTCVEKEPDNTQQETNMHLVHTKTRLDLPSNRKFFSIWFISVSRNVRPLYISIRNAIAHFITQRNAQARWKEVVNISNK